MVVAMGRPRTPLAVARWENEGGAVKHEAPSDLRRILSLDYGQAWRDPDSVPARESSSKSQPASGHELGSGQGRGANEQDLAGPQVGRRAGAREGETRAPRC
jgi:hypothetical protein